MKRRCVQGWGLALLVLFLDQWTKALALHYEPIHYPVIPHCFNFTLVTNPGSLWGMGGAYTNILALLGVLALILLTFFFFRPPCSNYPYVFGSLIGGISGNTYDRCIHGHVIDFLDFYIKNWHWPCFNVADIAISLACIYMLCLGGHSAPTKGKI